MNLYLLKANFRYIVANYYSLMEASALKIYIIDDDAVFQLLTKQLFNLSKANCSISFFYNGKEAFEFFKKNNFNPAVLPSIIFLDINMPIMNGWQFLDALYANNFEKNLANTQLYIVSSSIANSDIEKSKTYTVVKEFISKPLTLQKINAILEIQTS